MGSARKRQRHCIDVNEAKMRIKMKDKKNIKQPQKYRGRTRNENRLYWCRGFCFNKCRKFVLLMVCFALFDRHLRRIFLPRFDKCARVFFSLVIPSAYWTKSFYRRFEGKINISQSKHKAALELFWRGNDKELEVFAMFMLKLMEWAEEKKSKKCHRWWIHVKAVWNLLQSLLHLARFVVVARKCNSCAHTCTRARKQNHPDNAY